MSDDIEKNELLEDFQKFLEQSKLDSLVTNEKPDLNALLTEMTVLKTEVKAESRQFKTSLDTLSGALTTLEDERVENIQNLEKRHIEMMRVILLDFIDLYDRLVLAGDVLQSYQPVDSLFKHSRQKDVQFINGFKQGQQITIKRFEQLLQKQHVYPIDCIGKVFDPETMCAVDTASFAEIENGIVMDELRKGFVIHDQVLRIAEVRVNKIN